MRVMQILARCVDGLVFRVNPLEKASYTRVFQCLREEGTQVDAVLYLWADEDPVLVQNPAPMVYILQAMAETTLSIERILFAARAGSIPSTAVSWNHGSALSGRSAWCGRTRLWP